MYCHFFEKTNKTNETKPNKKLQYTQLIHMHTHTRGCAFVCVFKYHKKVFFLFFKKVLIKNNIIGCFKRLISFGIFQKNQYHFLIE